MVNMDKDVVYLVDGSHIIGDIAWEKSTYGYLVLEQNDCILKINPDHIIYMRFKLKDLKIKKESETNTRTP
jgi:hypothetical protein